MSNRPNEKRPPAPIVINKIILMSLKVGRVGHIPVFKSNTSVFSCNLYFQKSAPLLDLINNLVRGRTVHEFAVCWISGLLSRCIKVVEGKLDVIYTIINTDIIEFNVPNIDTNVWKLCKIIVHKLNLRGVSKSYPECLLNINKHYTKYINKS